MAAGSGSGRQRTSVALCERRITACALVRGVSDSTSNREEPSLSLPGVAKADNPPGGAPLAMPLAKIFCCLPDRGVPVKGVPDREAKGEAGKEAAGCREWGEACADALMQAIRVRSNWRPSRKASF